VLRPSIGAQGYFVVNLSWQGTVTQKAVHVLITLAFHGSKPSPEHQVAHADGDKLNNRPANLRWATSKQNSADMVRHGRSTQGERHGYHRLNEADILSIRARKRPLSYKGVGREYGVSPGCIQAIYERKSWRHL
jgi:hypothetical protein